MTQPLLSNLTELGLTKNQAAVYLALTQLGPSTTGPLIKRSGLYRVILYDTLDQVLALGLATYSLHKNTKVFEAVDPCHLVEMMRHKERIASQLVSDLHKITPEKPVAQGAFVYEGWNGIRAAQEMYVKEMKKGDGEYLMVGASRQLHKKLDAFFNYFHERRAKLRVPAKLLFNENNRRFGNLKKQYKPVQVRFMPQNSVTPSWISTYKDMVLIGVAEESPMAFFIKNKAVAESYQQYFYFMWERSGR